MTQTEALYSLGIPVTKNNFSSQAIITAPNTQPRAIVPAGYFGNGGASNARALYGHMGGSVANTAAATVAIVLLWDPTPGTVGTTLATPWPTLAPTAATTCVWELDFWITGQAAGGAGLTLQVNGKWRQTVGASGVLQTANQEIQFRSNITGLNSEALASIELAATWSVANAANTTTIDQFLLFGLN